MDVTQNLTFSAKTDVVSVAYEAATSTTGMCFTVWSNFLAGALQPTFRHMGQGKNYMLNEKFYPLIVFRQDDGRGHWQLRGCIGNLRCCK